jgi:aspartate aminotransferase-like enzyme
MTSEKELLRQVGILSLGAQKCVQPVPVMRPVTAKMAGAKTAVPACEDMFYLDLMEVINRASNIL